MISIEGGNAKIGDENGLENEKPVFETYIKSFYLDIDLVTVAEFRKFVKISRFITDADRARQASVFNQESNTWEDIAGANWEYPLGKTKAKAKDTSPVTLVSWNDAKAYATWLGKRLPTEFEWEYAVRKMKNNELKNTAGEYWQWCDNWFRAYQENSYYQKNRLNQEKVMRGGSFLPSIKESLDFRSSQRIAATPEQSFSHTGFRCAKDVE